MQFVIEADVYALSPSARKAILDHAQTQLPFLAQLKREAQTPLMKAGITAEIAYYKAEIEYYSEPPQILMLEAPQL